MDESLHEAGRKELIKTAAACYLRPEDGVLMQIMAAARGRNQVTAFHQVMVPEVLIEAVLKAYHEHALGGHLGFAKTYERLLRKYCRRTIKEDVNKHVCHCDTCCRRKNPSRTKRHELAKPFQRLSKDLYKAGCSSKDGNEWTLLFVDHITHFLEILPGQVGDGAPSTGSKGSFASTAARRSFTLTMACSL